MKTHIKSFYIAGFQYYDGASVMPQIEVGTQFQLIPESSNRYDEYAVAIYFEQAKLGYLPAEDNKFIHLLLRLGKIDNSDLVVMVQSLDTTKHPYKQILVGMFLEGKSIFPPGVPEAEYTWLQKNLQEEAAEEKDNLDMDSLSEELNELYGLNGEGDDYDCDDCKCQCDCDCTCMEEVDCDCTCHTCDCVCHECPASEDDEDLEEDDVDLVEAELDGEETQPLLVEVTEHTDTEEANEDSPQSDKL